MAWWIQSLEMADQQGKPTGRYRLTAESDEDGGGPYGLCRCANGHASHIEAEACPEAVAAKRKYG